MKKLLHILAPFFCALAASGVQAQEAEANFFRIEKAEVEEGEKLFTAISVVNTGAAPVTFVVNISGDNFLSNAKWPVKDVIAAHSTKEIARISTDVDGLVSPDGFRHVHLSYFYSVGDVFAKPDKKYRYSLPFEKGTEFRVAQVPGGTVITHRDDLSRYAIDMGVPEGTPVLAARAGVVIEVRDQFTEGGLDMDLVEKANLVSILHTDGTFAQYVHLAPEGVLVHPGDHVEVGQVIAMSGNTGYSAGPHLHFDLRRAVILPDGTVTQESIPFTFYHQGSRAKLTPRKKLQVTVN
jgi:murein DD-endopeptidase MepM/ murein hydrolase activator NlpD